MVSNIIAKCISIRKDQEDFLKDQRTSFNFSKFIQSKLDEYIKLKKEYLCFIEDDKK